MLWRAIPDWDVGHIEAFTPRDRCKVHTCTISQGHSFRDSALTDHLESISPGKVFIQSVCQQCLITYYCLQHCACRNVNHNPGKRPTSEAKDSLAKTPLSTARKEKTRALRKQGDCIRCRLGKLPVSLNYEYYLDRPSLAIYASNWKGGRNPPSHILTQFLRCWVLAGTRISACGWHYRYQQSCIHHES
jgi:hypothetical protein